MWAPERLSRFRLALRLGWAVYALGAVWAALRIPSLALPASPCAGEDYKSQQTPRGERDLGGAAEPAPAQCDGPSLEYHTPGRDRVEAEASEALKHPSEPEGRRME